MQQDDESSSSVRRGPPRRPPRSTLGIPASMWQSGERRHSAPGMEQSSSQKPLLGNRSRKTTHVEPHYRGVWSPQLRDPKKNQQRFIPTTSAPMPRRKPVVTAKPRSTMPLNSASLARPTNLPVQKQPIPQLSPSVVPQKPQERTLAQPQKWEYNSKFLPSPMRDAAFSGNSRKVKLLLTLGRAAHDPDKNGWTPLSLACQEGHLKVVNLLLAHGAKVNATVKASGATALHMASYSRTGVDFKIAQALLGHSADVNARDAENRTPLFKACELGSTELVEY